MSKNLYRLSSSEVYNFGETYLHNSYENFQYTAKEVNQIDAQRRIVRIIQENVVNRNLQHVNRLKQTAKDILNEHNKSQFDKKNLGQFLDSIQKIYTDSSQEGSFIYSINNLKDILMKFNRLDPKKTKNVNSKLDELQNSILNFHNEATKFIIKQRDSELPFTNTEAVLNQLASTKGKESNFEKYFKRRISSIKRTKNPLKNALKLVNTMSKDIYSMMGYAYEEILADSFIDNFLEGLVPDLKEKDKKGRVTDWFHELAVADISLNLEKFDVGFSVKQYDTDMKEKPYKTPDLLDVLMVGSEKRDIEFYKYLKNNIFFLSRYFKKEEDLIGIIAFEERITRLRMLARFFDGVYEVSEKGQFSYDYVTGRKFKTEIIPAVFWLTQTRVYWTHEILEYFLNASYEVEETKKAKPGMVKRATTKGLSVRLVERGTGTGTRKQIRDLDKMKKDISKERVLNYETISKRTKNLTRSYIKEMGSDLSFFTEARITFKLSQLDNLLK